MASIGTESEASIGVHAAAYLSFRSAFPSDGWSSSLESNAVIPLFQAPSKGHPAIFPRSEMNDSSMALDILLGSLCAVFPLMKSKIVLKTSSQTWGCSICPVGTRNTATLVIEESSILLSVVGPGETTVEAAIQHHFDEEFILPPETGELVLGRCDSCEKNTCNKLKLTMMGAPPDFLVVSPKIKNGVITSHGGRLTNIVPGSTFVFADFRYEVQGLTLFIRNHYINLVRNSAGDLVCVDNNEHSPCTAAHRELASTNTVTIVCTRSPILAAEDSRSPSSSLDMRHPRSESFASPPGQPPPKKPVLAVSTGAEHQPMATTPEEHAVQTLAEMAMLSGTQINNAGRNASAGETVGTPISPLASSKPFHMEDACRSAREQVQAAPTPPAAASLDLPLMTVAKLLITLITRITLITLISLNPP